MESQDKENKSQNVLKKAWSTFSPSMFRSSVPKTIVDEPEATVVVSENTTPIATSVEQQQNSEGHQPPFTPISNRIHNASKEDVIGCVPFNASSPSSTVSSRAVQEGTITTGLASNTESLKKSTPTLSARPVTPIAHSTPSLAAQVEALKQIVRSTKKSTASCDLSAKESAQRENENVPQHRNRCSSLHTATVVDQVISKSGTMVRDKGLESASKAVMHRSNLSQMAVINTQSSASKLTLTPEDSVADTVETLKEDSIIIEFAVETDKPSVQVERIKALTTEDSVANNDEALKKDSIITAFAVETDKPSVQVERTKALTSKDILADTSETLNKVSIITAVTVETDKPSVQVEPITCVDVTATKGDNVSHLTVEANSPSLGTQTAAVEGYVSRSVWTPPSVKANAPIDVLCISGEMVDEAIVSERSTGVDYLAVNQATSSEDEKSKAELSTSTEVDIVSAIETLTTDVKVSVVKGTLSAVEKDVHTSVAHHNMMMDGETHEMKSVFDTEQITCTEARRSTNSSTSAEGKLALVREIPQIHDSSPVLTDKTIMNVTCKTNIMNHSPSVESTEEHEDDDKVESSKTADSVEMSHSSPIDGSTQTTVTTSTALDTDDPHSPALTAPVQPLGPVSSAHNTFKADLESVTKPNDVLEHPNTPILHSIKCKSSDLMTVSGAHTSSMKRTVPDDFETIVDAKLARQVTTDREKQVTVTMDVDEGLASTAASTSLRQSTHDTLAMDVDKELVLSTTSCATPTSSLTDSMTSKSDLSPKRTLNEKLLTASVVAIDVWPTGSTDDVDVIVKQRGTQSAEPNGTQERDMLIAGRTSVQPLPIKASAGTTKDDTMSTPMCLFKLSDRDVQHKAKAEDTEVIPAQTEVELLLNELKQLKDQNMRMQENAKEYIRLTKSNKNEMGRLTKEMAQVKDQNAKMHEFAEDSSLEKLQLNETIRKLKANVKQNGIDSDKNEKQMKWQNYLEEAEKAINEKAKLLTEALEEISRLQKDKSSMKEFLNELTMRNEQKTNMLQNTMEQMEMLRDENVKVKETQAHADKRSELNIQLLQDALEEVGMLREENMKMRESQKEDGENIQVMSDSLQDANTKREESAKLFTDALADVSRLSEQNAKMKDCVQENLRLSAEIGILKTAETEVTRIKEEHGRLAEEVRMLKKHETSVVKLTEDNELMSAEVLRLRGRVSELEKISEDCTTYLEQVIKARDLEEEKNKTKISEMNTEVANSQRDLSTLEDSFGQLNERYRKMKEINANLHDNENLLKKAAEDNLQVIRAREDRYNALKEHAQKKISEANKQIADREDAHKREISTWSAKLQIAEMNITKLEKKITTQEEEYSSLNKLYAMTQELVAQMQRRA
eukprot:CFRG0402T1